MRTLLIRFYLFSSILLSASCDLLDLDKNKSNSIAELITTFGTTGIKNGQFQYIEDLAIGCNGKLYVTDAKNANIQVFTLDGKFITRFGNKGDAHDGDMLMKPEGIAVDKNCNIFIADYTTGFIKKFDKTHQWLKTFASYGSKPGQNSESEFMSFGPNDWLYMAEAGNSEIDVFDANGNFQFSFGEPGKEPGQLNRPEAAKVDSQGRIVVADLGNNRVNIYSPQGTLIRSFGSEGSGPGQLKRPAGIAMDSHDNIFVSEIGNNRISLFDKNGKFIASWGEQGKQPGQFSNVHGILYYKNRLYVADSGNDRVQVFSINIP